MKRNIICMLLILLVISSDLLNAFAAETVETEREEQLTDEYSDIDEEIELLEDISLVEIKDDTNTEAILDDTYNIDSTVELLAEEKIDYESVEYSISDPENVEINVLEQRGEDYTYISWSECEDADGYAVYRSVNGSELTLVKNVSSTETYNYGLVNGYVYTYAIRPYVYSDLGQKVYGDLSDSQNIQIGVVAPRNLIVEQKTESSVMISWEGDPLADGYLLYRSMDSETWELVKSVYDVSTRTYNLQNGEDYYFKLKAFRTICGKKRYSSESEVIKVEMGLKHPECFNIDLISSSSIHLSWNLVKGATAYRIYRSEDGGEYRLIKTVETNETMHYGLNPNKKYTFKVAAISYINGNYVKGGDSEEIDIRLSLDMVNELNVLRKSSNSVSLSWTAVDGATAYRLYRVDENGVKSLVKTISDTQTVTYGLEDGRVYKFSVKPIHITDAYSPVGVESNQISYYNSQITGLSTEQYDSKTIKLTWNSIQGATAYRVYCKSNDGLILVKETDEESIEIDGTVFPDSTWVITAVREDVEGNCGEIHVIFSESTINSSRHRALLIGEENYVQKLQGPINDMNAMSGMLDGFVDMDWEIYKQSDATKDEIVSLVNLAFADASEDDISLFYYSGHGATGAGNDYSGALMTVDYEYFTLQDLAEVLANVPGKIVVILDSCGSGAAISDQPVTLSLSDEFDAKEFNDEVIEAFDSYSSNGKNRSKDMANAKFYVLTASSYEENSRSIMVDNVWGGVFTRGITESTGYDFNTHCWSGKMYGDTDENGILTLQECYQYAASFSQSYQNAQVYPKNSTFELFFK